MKVAIIGGSGFYDLLENPTKLDFHTSAYQVAEIYQGLVGGNEVIFVPRHGQDHQLTPSNVNYAGNIFNLKKMGVGKIISVSAVGSLKEDLAPQAVVIPNQFIDQTFRPRSFFGWYPLENVVGHVPMAKPVCPSLAKILHSAALHAKPQGKVQLDGTYVCIEGPQFSSQAESKMFISWGGDIIGMTNATEAKFAREAGICYASACFITDYDCWKDDQHVSIEQIMQVMKKNAGIAKDMVTTAVAAMVANQIDPCECWSYNKNCVITPRKPGGLPVVDETLNTLMQN